MWTDTETENKIDLCLRIIREYEWLLDSYVADFFVEEHWFKLPPCWQNFFFDVDPSELSDLLLNSKLNKIYPLSLLALVTIVKNLSIRRTPSEALLDRFKTENEASIAEHMRSSFDSVTRQTIISNEILLNKLLKKCVKEKKRHEISLISNLIYNVAKITNCNSIVDVGSGLGHLIRTLAYKYFMNTLGVDANSKLIDKACNMDYQFYYTANKSVKNETLLKKLQPQHINMMLSPNNKDIKSKMINLHKPVPKEYGIVGLHPCGNLGPLLLEIFHESPEIKFICIVGCCYMKLSCNPDEYQGYPMSEFVKNIENNKLSQESRELACHAIEMYSDRLKKGQYEDLKIHCFRAVLEKILISKWPHIKRLNLKSVKHYNTLCFETYCEKALEKLKIPITKDDIHCINVQNNLSKWKQVVIFYTLRLLLAPIVETVILLDRIKYLRENGYSCELIPFFDPMLSPRNHILIAQKM